MYPPLQYHKEYYLLWIAAEAIAAPLPPLWSRMARDAPGAPPELAISPDEIADLDGTTPQNDARFYYQHAVTAEVPASPAASRRLPTPSANPALARPRPSSQPFARLRPPSPAFAQVCELHPLLPVFREAVDAERRRKDKPRPWSSVEAWVAFGGEDEGLYFYNFATRTRSRDLPADLVNQARV